MAGVKGRSGGARPNSGGARPGAGAKRKPVVPLVIDGPDPARVFGAVPAVLPAVATPVATSVEPVPAASDQVAEYDSAEFLRRCMRQVGLDERERIRCAIALLPYEHVKPGEAGKKKIQKDAAAEKTEKGSPYTPAAAPPKLARVK